MASHDNLVQTKVPAFGLALTAVRHLAYRRRRLCGPCCLRCPAVGRDGPGRAAWARWSLRDQRRARALSRFRQSLPVVVKARRPSARLSGTPGIDVFLAVTR